MRKLLLRIIGALLALSVLLAAGCKQEGDKTNETTKAPETTAEELTDDPGETTAEAQALRDPKDIPVINPNAKERGTIRYLSIGQSANVNVTHYLYEFLKEAGYEKVEIAVLYYSGCNLDQHYDFMRKDSAVYRLYFNGKGTWSITEGYTMDMALRMTQWDYISFNPGSGKGWKHEQFEPFLTDVEEHVRSFQPNAHFFWNMIWAYEDTPDYKERFDSMFSGTQLEMHYGIVEASRIVMENHPELEFMVPIGTAIQSMRTSHYTQGAWLIRDSGHLSYGYGYYLGALVMAKSISDLDIDASTFLPPEYADTFDEDIIAALKGAVKAAFEDPWHVTEQP